MTTSKFEIVSFLKLSLFWKFRRSTVRSEQIWIKVNSFWKILSQHQITYFPLMQILGLLSMYFDAVVLFFKKKITFIQTGFGHTMVDGYVRGLIYLVAKPSWISGLYWTFPRFSGKIYCNDLLWWLQLEFYCAWLCEI